MLKTYWHFLPRILNSMLLLTDYFFWCLLCLGPFSDIRLKGRRQGQAFWNYWGQGAEVKGASRKYLSPLCTDIPQVTSITETMQASFGQAGHQIHRVQAEYK